MLGQPIIIDYKPGAGGSVGAEMVAKSPADGYTLMLANTGVAVINGALYSKLPYDPGKDFAPITTVIRFPNVLVVNKDNVTQQRYVQLGQQVGALRVVTGGLTADDLVVIGELWRSSPGTKVTPQLKTID